jgi:DNA-binding SARP family transcriptional activator
LEPDDRDPAVFLTTVIAGAQRLYPGVGRSTLEQMRLRPGPLRGWPALFAQLGHELGDMLPATTALVLERSHHVSGPHPTLRQFNKHLLPALPSGMSCVLIAHQPLPRADLPAHTLYYSAGDLRLDDRAACALAARLGGGLAVGSILRAVALAGGRAVVLEGLFALSAVYGPALIDQAVARSSSMDALLAQVARACLATAGPDELQALALTLQVEYSHPELLRVALSSSALPAGPWLQPLVDGWQRVRMVWQAPLRKALSIGSPERGPLRRAANYLADQGATERAVALYLAIGDTAAAARTISDALSMVMDLGQWETLAGWLSRIPAHELHSWPWLIYARGEIALAQSDQNAASDAFALASSLFAMRQDAEGACQSRLAESSLALGYGNHAHAQERAQSALAIAESANLVTYQSWAAWHLGRLSADAGDLDAALMFYERAAASADAAGDLPLAELLRPARQHMLRQRDLRHQREFYRQAYVAAEHAEHAAAEALYEYHTAAPDRAAALLDAHGWLRTPLALKLPPPLQATASAVPSKPANLWRRLLDAFGVGQSARPPAASAWPSLEIPAPPTRAGDHPPPIGLPLLTAASDTDTAARTGSVSTSAQALDQGTLEPNIASAFSPIALIPADDQRASPVERAPLPTLTAHLLGQFRVILKDHPVLDWPSGRGRALFKYLLTHHDRAIPRDVLMDTFWPDAGPEAARNSLNVTLHRLRQALRTADDAPIVIFEDGAYRLNPDLQIWLDVEDFERHAQAGQQFEAADQLAAAVTEYELAIGIYQGDFLEDDPYDDWPVLTRERLRVAYLDALDRLGQMYFDQGQHAACIMICQRLLARDSCREDAHCRLMRCYSRQGQRYLALRQYQVCVEALRAELDVAPDQATTQLYERIRRREPV